jgi:hypothetical protein
MRYMILLPFVLFAGYWASGKEHNGNRRTYVCAEANPQSVCEPSNTCGSASATCNIDVKRTGDGASATPDIPGAKGNALFCVRVGTTVKWHSSSKNTGFIADFGSAFPFEPAGTIMGGSDRSVSVVAKKPGCYKFSVGACNTNAIYGMCADGSSEIVIAGK